MTQKVSKANFFFIFVLLCGMLGLAANSEAANRYVLAGAAGAGTGADWTNAYAALPASLVRGDTYYIADGTYGSYIFDDATSGSSVITIKKATIADHGTNTGWQDSYGDGQTTLGRQIFNTSYITIDGNRSFVDWGDRANNYGFLCSFTAGNQSQGCFDIPSSTNGINHIIIKSVSVHPTEVSGIEYRGFLIFNADTITVSNVEVYSSYGDCFKFQNTNNVIVEYAHCHDRLFDGASHGDGFENHSVSNFTLRYSFIDWDGQLYFFGADTSGQSGSHYFYGNIFYGHGSSAQGLCKNDNAITPGPVYIYNNTFYDFPTLAGLVIEAGPSPLNIPNGIINNIFVTNSTHTFSGAYAWKYNAYTSNTTVTDPNKQTVTSSIFTTAGTDFRLANGTNAGDSTIGANYGIALDGKTRGSDGTWDRGAYEYGGSVTAVPAPPGSLSVQ